MLKIIFYMTKNTLSERVIVKKYFGKITSSPLDLRFDTGHHQQCSLLR